LFCQEVPVRKINNLGLSQSKLNDRYRSIEKLEVPVMVHNQEYMSRAEVDEQLESISQRGVNKQMEQESKGQWSKFGLSGSNLNDRSRNQIFFSNKLFLIKKIF
jgi:hypothetical protein